jgi:folate-binding Fe-S cluster repair protein YgfZ
MQAAVKTTKKAMVKVHGILSCEQSHGKNPLAHGSPVASQNGKPMGTLMSRLATTAKSL